MNKYVLIYILISEETPENTKVLEEIPTNNYAIPSPVPT